jgi:5-methylcytosine-specific restriction endonuclease McrA
MAHRYATFVEEGCRRLSQREVKSLVWRKSCGHCWYCGVIVDPFEDFVVDHFVSRARGGGDELTNLVPSCRWCNSAKGARTIEGFRQRLMEMHLEDFPDDAGARPEVFHFEMEEGWKR